MMFETGSVGFCFGDSIMQGVGLLKAPDPPTEDVASQMAPMLGATIYNGGIGGTRLSRTTPASFTEVIDAIVTGDWTAVNARIAELRRKIPEFEGLQKLYAKIETLDFNAVDFLVISYGANDWSGCAPLDDPADRMNAATYCGALRVGVKKLLTAYPHLRFYFFTPTYRTFEGESADTRRNALGLLHSDYADAMVKTCRELHLPCCDLYAQSNTNEWNWHYYTADGSHRNARGYRLLAQQYAKFILSH